MKFRASYRCFVSLLFLCAFQTTHAENLAIVAAGDSITQGCCGNSVAYDSYRKQLEALLQANSCSHTFKGSQTEASEASTYSGRHEGYSGWWAHHIISGHSSGPRAIEDTVEQELPDVILMHLGSNDLNGTGPDSNVAQSVDKTLDNIRQVISKANAKADQIDLPRPKILLARPIPWLGGSEKNPNIAADIELLGEKISESIAIGFPESTGSSVRDAALANLHEVDVFTDFDPAFMQADLVHPNLDGETFIAEKFYQALVDTGFCQTSIPTQATLISPDGSTTSDSPEYAWNAVANASWYYLWVQDSTGVPVKRWYTSADAQCANGENTCRVNPQIAISGDAAWWIRTWNQTGVGPWSDKLMFSNSQVPSRPELISPQGSESEINPTYAWNRIEGATWYHLWVNDATGNPIRRWYEVVNSEITCDDTTCSVTPTAAINGTARWWVRAWNSSGYSPWSAAFTFTP